MKLDLATIHKLTPPGLYELADLRAFVVLLVRVVRLGIGGGKYAKFYAHMLVRHTKELRTKTRANLNLKIKAWVLQCPKRIIQARSVIGEAVIRRWIIRMRAAYMSPRLMDAGLQKNRQAKNPDVKPGHIYRPGPRKPFALARLEDVEKLLPFRPRWPRTIEPVFTTETGNLRHGARLAGAEHMGKLQQPNPPNPANSHKPVRFFPSELGVIIREAKTANPAQKHDKDPCPKPLEKSVIPDKYPPQVSLSASLSASLLASREKPP